MVQQEKFRIETSNIETEAVRYPKITLNMETAIATLPPTNAYKIFTTAFGTPPIVTLVVAGTLAHQSGTGTVRFRADVLRRRPGSFQWSGTPSVSVRWTAWGIR